MKKMLINIYLRHDYEIFEQSDLVGEVTGIDLSTPLIGLRNLADDDEDMPEYWYYSYNKNIDCLVTYDIDVSRSYYYR